MATTFTELVGRLQAEVGDYYPPVLAKIHLKSAMRELSQRWTWSWLFRSEEIIVPASISGEVTVVNNAMTVTTSAAFATSINTLTGPPIGRRQLRIGTGGGNIFEIRAWDGTNILTLNAPVPIADGTYPCTLVKCYYLPPSVEQALGDQPAESSNFGTYITVRDKSNNFPLILKETSSWLDKRDPRRDSVGTPTHFIQSFPTTNRLAGAGNLPGQVPIGTARRELWPHPSGTYVYDALYLLNYWPLGEESYELNVLPETLDPELVIQSALVKSFSWAMGQRTISSRIQGQLLSQQLTIASGNRERLYMDAFRQDQLYYATRQKDLLGGKFPYVMGAAYAQVHDVALMSGMFVD